MTGHSEEESTLLNVGNTGRRQKHRGYVFTITINGGTDGSLARPQRSQASEAALDLGKSPPSRFALWRDLIVPATQSFAWLAQPKLTLKALA